MSKKEKERIYEEWIKQIAEFEHLDFVEAKKLYQRMSDAPDEDKAREYFNRLIEGTLYVVARFIKNNNFSSIDNINFDMNDVINATSELWMRKIKTGILLEKDTFYKIFDTTFYKELSQMLIGIDFTVAEITAASTDNFSDLLHAYIEFSQKNGGSSYDDFIRIFSEYFGVENLHSKINNRLNAFGLSDMDLIEQTYELFEGIIGFLENEDGDISYNKRKLDLLKNILLDSGLQRLRLNVDDVYEKDMTDGIIKKMNYKDLIDAINNCVWLDDRAKDIVFKVTGSNGEKKISLTEAAREYGITLSRASEIYYKSLRYIRHNGNVRKCLK